MASQNSERLREVAIAFFKLGLFAFGGPVAHIALMDDELVKRRQWLSREKFLDLIGITNLIPGPNSTELAIHIGYERAGWPGLLVAGTTFILPAMLMVWALAAVYVQFQTLPQVSWFLYGVKPVIIILILQALWKLGKKALKNKATAVAAVVVIVLYGAGVNEVLLLLIAGLGVILVQQSLPIATYLLPIPLLISTPSPPVSTSWIKVFLVFLKIGSLLYGSGYVLLAFLQREWVERLSLLSSQQILDAVAIGQVTPGPVFTTATFIGYLLAGNAGAIAATVGIFLPAFVGVAIVNPWASKLRQSQRVSSFLDGVNAGSLGLMAAVAWQLGGGAIVDGWTGVMAIVSGILLLGFGVNSVGLIFGGGILGMVLQLLKVS